MPFVLRSTVVTGPPAGTSTPGNEAITTSQPASPARTSFNLATTSPLISSLLSRSWPRPPPVAVHMQMTHLTWLALNQEPGLLHLSTTRHCHYARSGTARVTARPSLSISVCPKRARNTQGRERREGRAESSDPGVRDSLGLLERMAYWTGQGTGRTSNFPRRNRFASALRSATRARVRCAMMSLPFWSSS